MRKVILPFLFLILTTHLSLAQNALLKGRVINMSDSTTIIGAVVVVTDSTKSLEKIAVTDAEGEYVIENCPERFVIAISHMGYEKFRAIVSLKELEFNSLLTTLEPDVQSIGDITVTAAPPTLVRKSNKFVMDGIHRSPLAKGRSSTEFFKFIPMLKVDEKGISILTKSVSEVQLNGRSIGSGEAAMVILRGIPAEDIERVEITPVTGSAYSASSEGGIVNVVLKKRPDEGVRATVSLSGSQSHYDSEGAAVFLSYATGKLNLTSGFSVSKSRYYSNFTDDYRYLSDDLRSTNDMTMRYNSFGLGGYLNLDYNINKKHTVGIRISTAGGVNNSTSNSTTDYSKISSGVLDSVYTQLSDSKSPWHTVPVGVNFNHTFKSDDRGSKLQTDFFYTYSPSDNTTSNVYTKTAGGVNSIASDFLQRQRYYSNHFTVKSNYNHVFKDESELESGIYVSAGKRDNDFLYANRSGGGHVSDPKRSNRFVYSDLIMAAFVSYEREWSDKFSTVVGLRTEKYLGRGEQKTTDETISRNEFDVFPNISLTYTISENHVLSLDVGSSIHRPSYSHLNPFDVEVSPTLYRKSNPNLKSTKSFKAFFNYNFFKDFNLAIDYNLSKNGMNDIYIPDGNGRTMILTDNYGNSSGVYFDLNYSKYLFDNRWYISADITLDYLNVDGEVEGIKLNVSDWSYSFGINNNIVLSKKLGLSVSVGYYYNSKSQGTTASYDQSHSLNLSLLKTFKNSSLSFNAYNLLDQTSKHHTNFAGYQRTSTFYGIPTYSLSYTYTFGNRQVKQLQGRGDSALERRMQ